LRERRPEVPHAIAAVLDRMLAKKPSERFGTPAEVAAALESYAAVIPDSSANRSLPSSPAPAARPPSKRSLRRIGLVAGLAARLLLAGAFAFLSFRDGGAKTPGQPSGQPIKVGILHSRTGTMAISEKPVIDATLFAIEELNARGGVLGRQVEPVV